MSHRDKLIEERRKYLRLDTVFPVQFHLLSLDGSSLLSDLIQGYTNNIGKGGLCLVVNMPPPELVPSLKENKAKISLQLEMPVSGKSIPAIAKVAWIKEIPGEQKRYLIGLGYEEIDPSHNKGIMRYAWLKKLFMPFVLTVIFILALAFALNTYIGMKLIKGNKALVEQLVKIVQESSIAKQKVKEINKEKEDLQIKIDALQVRINTVEEEKSELAKKVRLEEITSNKKIKELNELIDKLSVEKDSLQQQMIAVQHKENNIAEELLRLDKKKDALEKANFDNMYKWLTIHQNPRTGLVMSFEGDKEIENWAFIYDQALILQAYTYFSDFDRCRKMLDFFQRKAERVDGKFLNAYYVSDGKPAEFIIHSGPNIWLGISVVQYTHKTRDFTYINIAEDIAREIIRLQNEDPEGGIRGGPEVNWYATEHNLDAYAFFNMLYKVTQKTAYKDARDRVMKWLLGHTYDKGEVPIKRGKGDSTIATDTYAWSIAAVGPEKLFEVGMNPDRIMEFAEENCGIEVRFRRPQGEEIKLKGFDFAPQRHVARGGVVSSEWTAQMIISFNIMADYYFKKGMIAKARSYKLKADTYLSELVNMIISSPSPSGQGESCLPYATQDFVDTGHGWMTPKGNSTGSVSGTAYTLFAYYKYNPLEFKE